MTVLKGNKQRRVTHHPRPLVGRSGSRHCCVGGSGSARRPREISQGQVAPPFPRRCAGARDSDTPGGQDNLCIVLGLSFYMAAMPQLLTSSLAPSLSLSPLRCVVNKLLSCGAKKGGARQLPW
jgi:hypothetical protein